VPMPLQGILPRLCPRASRDPLNALGSVINAPPHPSACKNRTRRGPRFGAQALRTQNNFVDGRVAHAFVSTAHPAN
jgi:hypothetical protein